VKEGRTQRTLCFSSRLDLPLLIEASCFGRNRTSALRAVRERNRRRKKRSTSPARSVIKLSRESSQRFAFGRNRDMAVRIAHGQSG
jgi:hypothetical protein